MNILPYKLGALSYWIILILSVSSCANISETNSTGFLDNSSQGISTPPNWVKRAPHIRQITQITVCDEAWVVPKKRGLFDTDYNFIFAVYTVLGNSCEGPRITVDEIVIWDMSNHHTGLGIRNKWCNTSSQCVHIHTEDNRRGDLMCYHYSVKNKGEVVASSGKICKSSVPPSSEYIKMMWEKFK